MPLKKILLVLPIVLPLLGGVIWMVRLEGRVDAHDQRFTEADNRFGEIRDDLRYVRDRIDQVLARPR